MRQRKRRKDRLAAWLQDHLPEPRPRRDVWAWASNERMRRATTELVRMGGDPAATMRDLAKTATVLEWKYP